MRGVVASCAIHVVLCQEHKAGRHAKCSPRPPMSPSTQLSLGQRLRVVKGQRTGGSDHGVSQEIETTSLRCSGEEPICLPAYTCSPSGVSTNPRLIGSPAGRESGGLTDLRLPRGSLLPPRRPLRGHVALDLHRASKTAVRLTSETQSTTVGTAYALLSASLDQHYEPVRGLWRLLASSSGPPRFRFMQSNCGEMESWQTLLELSIGMSPETRSTILT
ncbi:hypothetical protein GGR56DRAFT_445198 [Xylariaceae sp. FL0804]|nr:hypothetical protein GGR56DRAFT_445198 [Xylariaceae sp. FL0804]